ADAQELIDPSDGARHRVISLLVSRPVAVTKATVSVELAADPPHSQSWAAFLRTIAGDGRDESGLTEVVVPVKLGAPPPDTERPARLDDGLIGFWLDDDTLRMPKSTMSHERIAPHDSEAFPPRVHPTIAGEPTVVTMLVDPRGQVHAISGIVPTKRLVLDP